MIAGSVGLGGRRIVYVWADSVYFQPRMAEGKAMRLGPDRGG